MAGVAMLACFTPTSIGAAVAGDEGWRRRNADSAMSPLLSQSSCFTSSYIRLRGKERARQLSMSTQYVLNGASRSPSASFLGLSDRIASSQFCSCSTSFNISSASLDGKGKRDQIEGPFFVKRRNESKVWAGLKQVNLAGGVPELTRPWTRRRRGQSLLQAGRGPQSENVDVGGFKFETKSGGNEGDGTVGENGDLAGLVKRIGEVVVGDGEASSDEEIEDESPFSWMNNLVSKRWTIVIMCFFAFLLCNMDRVNMSIAVLPMQTEYHWTSMTVGLVQSSFFWGYLLTQVAGGIWADSIGGKQVLGFGVIWWSLATIATPIAAKIGLPALFFVRACMGVGEGVAMPAMNNLLSRWIPVQERSRALAFVYSGMYLGSVIGLACSPTLIQRFGWPSVFFSFGSVGAIWFTIWQKYAYSSPSEDPMLSEGERKLILKGNKPKEPITRIPWGLLLSKAPVWALIVCHFCHNWGTFILLTWMPTYYNQVLGFNLMESGLLSVLPWLTMAISANLGGWIADTLVGKGYSVTVVRKIMQSIGFLGPAFFLTQLSHITSAPLAVMCMMACQGTDAFSQAGLYSNHQDIGPRYSGILLGLSNTAGVLAGVFGTAATGYILQHGTWDDVFKVAVGLYIFGTIVWNVFSTGEQLFE